MNESNPDYLCAVVVRVCSMRFNQIPAVRVHAVKALELLQSEESVQMELAKLLEGDPNADVRKTVLSVIVVTKDTLPGEHLRSWHMAHAPRGAPFNESCFLEHLV